MTQPAIISFDEFRRFLSDQLGVAEMVLTPETSFMNDLAIESLKLLELVFQLERQLGRHIPSDVAWEIQTVGDAYALYLELMRTQP